MPDTTVDARQSREDLAMWLRAGRTQRKLSLEDVAKITKIQPRILDKLERGELDGLPAEVFVRGFVRSFAKCVGLDESEALVRFTACSSTAIPATAKALVESMGLARTKATGTPPQPTQVVEPPQPAEPAAAAVEVAQAVEVAAVVEPAVEVPAVVEAPAEPVIEAVEAVIEAAPVAETGPGGAEKKKRSRKNKGNPAPRSQRKKKQTATPVVAAEAAPVDDDACTTQITKVSLETGPVAKVDGESLDTTSIEAKTSERTHDASVDVEMVDPVIDGSVSEPHLASGSDRISSREIAAVEAELDAQTTTSGTWQPTMPAITTTPSVPWRRPNITAPRAYVVPSLVIDDADPDSADREREDRSSKEHRVSFLPPILLDREDRSARQGGLTLAVIILLIAATLTLSYLMRRPSASGDGVTMNDAHGSVSQLLS